MSVRYQLVIDCADPGRQANFWAAALGYEVAPPPSGFAAWDDYYRDLGLPEEALTGGPGPDQRPAGRWTGHLVPCGIGREGCEEPAAHRHPRQRRPDRPD
ncbi:VOC family protein [Streptomyces sp. NPDC058470]|uniref:VOC family protein n=1 Tax=Streptomyces sp. NPDC058470 TaxID=3346515 RepID=UPI003657E8CD